MKQATRQTSRKTLTAPIRKVRFAWVAIFFCVWVGAIGARLVSLQAIQHAEWVDKAKRQQNSAYELAPQRGVLYDRNLRELAMTVLVDSIYVDPSKLGENRAQRLRCCPRWCIPIPRTASPRSSRCWRASTTRRTLRGWRGGWTRRRRIACAS